MESDVLLFSLVSCSHTFFSEEVPSRWNQSTFFSFCSLVGKSLFKDIELQGESQWSWAAVGDDSVFYNVFHSFGLFPSSLLSVSDTVYPSPLLPMTEQRQNTLLSSSYFSISHMLTITNHKH